MLTQLSITGFRCFRQLDVELKPLTVLIGPNDTGKSAFLDAVDYMSATERFRYLEFDRFRGLKEESVELLATNDVGERVGQKSNETVPWNPARSISDVRRSSTTQRFQLPVSGIATECDGFEKHELSTLFLGRDGQRVAAVLDHLLRTDLKTFLALQDDLRHLVPGFDELRIDTPQKQLRKIEFQIDGGFRIPADKTSAGVRLLLFFLTLIHHPNPPKIILLEEPETGIHPKRLGDVMDLLRGITQGKFGKSPAQVILTTHSPYLLDYVKPDEDQVLVFQRADDGSRTAKPVDWGRLKEFFDGFMLGEIWFNEEEAGLVAQEAS